MIINYSGQTLDKFTTEQHFDALWKAAMHCNKAVALWKEPGTELKHLVIDLSEEVAQRKLDIEDAEPGFAVSSFVNKDMSSTRFIKADIYLNTSRNLIDWISEQDHVSKSATTMLEAYQQALHSKKSESAGHVAAGSSGDSSGKQAYTELVDKAVQAINRGQFQKVVLARTKEVKLPANFDLFTTFLKLCAAYPNAFVSLFFIPGEGVWMGATPEVLISVDDQQQFRTMSLAGTQALTEGKCPATASWTHKEIEEQALVSRYIINCFKKIRLREFEEIGPRTVAAGNLMHLRTDYVVDMNATGFPQLGTTMLDLLHPTSAVCGMPKEDALQFILQNEQQDRKFYSGFLGPVNIEGASTLYVNLRCMEIAEGKATLYAGAGITAGSVAEKEWLETEIKCQTLLSKIIDQSNQ